MSGKKIISVFRREVSERFPLIVCSSCKVLQGECSKDVRLGRSVSYFLGDLTPSTRLSKACLAGVAVEADDICTESQDMERGGARSRGVTASYHESDQRSSHGKTAAGPSYGTTAAVMRE